MSFRTVLADPMLRMLVAAIALAALLPATGDARSAAQMIANAAIFVLFLLNGMRIARRDIAAGIANWRFLLPLVLWVFGAMALAGLALAALCYPLPNLKQLAVTTAADWPTLAWMLQELKFAALLTVFAASVRLGR